MQTTYNWNNNYLYLQIKGTFVLEDYITIISTVTGDKRYPRLGGIIADAAEADIRFTEKELLTATLVGKVYPEYNHKKLKFAYISIPSQDSIVESYIFKMGQSLWERRVFKDKESAVQWIEGK